MDEGKKEWTDGVCQHVAAQVTEAGFAAGHDPIMVMAAVSYLDGTRVIMAVSPKAGLGDQAKGKAFAGEIEAVIESIMGRLPGLREKPQPPKLIILPGGGS